MEYLKRLGWITFFISVVLLLTQFGIIGVYFFVYIGPSWLSWYVGMCAVVNLWFSITFAYDSETDQNPNNSATDRNPNNSATNRNPNNSATDRNPNNSETDRNPNNSETDRNPNPNHVSLAYKSYMSFGWFIYCLILIPQVVVLFYRVTDGLERKSVLGPRTLQVTLSITPFLFVAFVYGHYNRNESQSYVIHLASVVAFDLFDGVEILENLFVDDLTSTVSNAIKIKLLILSSCNFLLPVIAVFNLRSSSPSRKSFKVYYKICSLGVNVSYLIARIFLWLDYDKDISVMFMKNIMLIAINLEELIYYRCVEYNSSNQSFTPQQDGTREDEHEV